MGWLSGLLSAEIFISTGEWGGPDANTDRLKQSISAVRASGGFPGNVVLFPCQIVFVIILYHIPEVVLMCIYVYVLVRTHAHAWIFIDIPASACVKRN